MPLPSTRRSSGIGREGVGVVGLVGAGVGRGPFGADGGDGLPVGIVDRAVAQGQVRDGPIVEDAALAGGGENEELVGVVAADRSGIGAHRDRLQSHALVGADVADHVAVVGVQRVVFRKVEIVAVLHQELAAAHHAEPGTDLVAEFPLDVVERERQVLVGRDRRPEDVGDQLLVGRTVEHVAFVAVGDAEHLLAVDVVPAALAPEIRRLDRRHQHGDVAGAGLFLMHDALDVAQHLEAHGQPGIDPGAGLADHAGAQHQPVARDLRLGGGLLEHGQEIAGQTHRALRKLGEGPADLGQAAPARNGRGGRTQPARKRTIFIDFEGRT